jgi:predicted O-linked N-acetylglucosamine transferase (SPINDLY family)
MSTPAGEDAGRLLRRAERALALGETAKAEAAWQRILAVDPGHPEALFHLGNRCRERGEHAPAIAHYEHALARAPGHPGLLNNLGLALEAIGSIERAEACYRDILTREPQPDALLNLANLLYNAARYADSAEMYRRACVVRRDLSPAVWVQRALAQERIRDFAGAEASLLEAARLTPDDVRLHTNLATLYVRQARHADAEKPLQHALALDPDHPYALSMLASSRQHRCVWAGLSELFARIQRLLESGGGDQRYEFNPFPILSMPLSLSSQLRAAQRWARHLAPAAPTAAPRVTTSPGERLRVGFVSSDFRDHAMAFLSMEFWERIDRRRVEAFAYGLGPTDTGPTGLRIARAFEHFTDVSAEPTARIVERIRADRIAVLFDLNGYTRHAREAIFPARPAPVQVNCLGFPGTLGATWYDYIFTDRYALPAEFASSYVERPLYMPHAAFPSDTTRWHPQSAPSRAECGLPEQGFVFCCFNRTYKILPDVFAIWMRWLQAVPGSVLWLLEARGDAKENLQREARAASVDPNRLVFAPRTPMSVHLVRNAVPDLFVDTFPYGGHTTANDALLAGLPVLTCAGETLASRIAGSQLRAIGLSDLITTHLADYEALGLELATRPDLLQGHRRRLAANRLTYPLFDMERYAHDFADAVERVWSDYRAGTPP